MDDYRDDIDLEQDEHEQRQRARREKLRQIAEALLTKRDEAIAYRASSGVERRWREDEAIYEGMEHAGTDMIDHATGEASRTSPREQARRSKVIVNVVRPRCETAEGRFCDILLPTDDKNWGLKATPDPEIDQAMQDQRPAMQGGQPITDKQGQQKTMAQVALDRKARADKAMRGMETTVEDQLVECDYNGEIRKAIRQSIRTGTGIIKGPVVKRRAKHRFKATKDEQGNIIYTIKADINPSPASRWVSHWNVYPAPGAKEDVQRTAEYIWERDEILPRDVRKLIGMPGYDEEQLRQVLEEEPKRCNAAPLQGGAYSANRYSIEKGRAYEQWEYHGEVSRDDLKDVGCECPPELEGKSLSACVIFINERPVKVDLNILDTGALPYDFFQWTTLDSNSPWGIGISRQMIWLARIITAAWRAMMDNAGDSAGANVVVNKSLKPADGRWEIGGKKLWFTEDAMEDVTRAFAQFQLANTQESLQAIIELALRFVDLETSLPTIFQGEVQEIPETLGATNIMVDSSNVGLRHRVKLFDDRVTDPHLTRYYHWNMMYHDNQEIKGDFEVDARGVSVLLEKDQQAQLLLQIFQLKADPDVNRKVDWDKATEMFFQSRRLPILKDEGQLAEYDQKMAQQAGQGQAMPAVEVAKIRTEGAMAQEQLRQESDMAEIQAKAEEAERQRQHNRAMKEMELNMAMMQFSESNQISLEKLKAQLAISAAGMNLQRELSTNKESKPERTTPQVAEPPTEPPGRAPAGQAYER
jgi:hypothetical protein